MSSKFIDLTIEELACYVKHLPNGRKIDFVFEPYDCFSSNYSVYKINLMDEKYGSIVIGYYGGGDTKVTELCYGTIEEIRKIISQYCRLVEMPEDTLFEVSKEEIDNLEDSIYYDYTQRWFREHSEKEYRNCMPVCIDEYFQNDFWED